MSSNKVKLFIPCGGGLGDVIQAYLSSPPNHWSQSYDTPDEFPTSDNYVSLWFRRLEDFKLKNPDTIIKIIAMCHNPAVVDLFAEHPCIDSVDLIQYITPDMEKEGHWWEHEIDGYRYIRYLYNYEDYESTEPKIYVDSLESMVYNNINSDDYVVIHPFAGIKHRMPLDENDYIIIIDKLISEGFTPIVVGGSYKRNSSGGDEYTTEKFDYDEDRMIGLVNNCSVRLTTLLSINANGFIGTHSSMILPAWYNRVRSVCIVPPTHDGGQAWEEFASSGNPTAWGFKQDFNKTVIVRDKSLIDYDDIVRWIVGNSNE